MTATDNSKMSSTPKRTRITYKKRQEIVPASKKPGIKIEDAAKEYGLGVSTLYKIVKEHEGGHGPREDVKCKRTLPDLQVELEKRLIQWIISTEKRGVMVDGNFLKARAIAIAEELKVDLKFSNGWIQGFKSRHNLKWRTAHGEKKSADFQAAEEWRDSKWPGLKSQYK